MFRVLLSIALLGFAFVFFGGQTARAVETDEIIVKFRTTEDDKDKEMGVSIEVYKDGKLVGKSGPHGKGVKWDNNTNQPPFPVKLNGLHETKGMEVKVIKDGTDGWVFDTTICARVVKEKKSEEVEVHVKKKTELRDDKHEARFKIEK